VQTRDVIRKAYAPIIFLSAISFLHDSHKKAASERIPRQAINTARVNAGFTVRLSSLSLKRLLALRMKKREWVQ